MRSRVYLSCLAGLILPCLAVATEPLPGPVYEIAEVDGVRVGGRVVTAVKAGGDAEEWTTTATLDLSLRRYGAVVRLRREEATLESAEGAVRGFSVRQGVPGGKQLIIRGGLEDGRMVVTVDERPKRPLLWYKDVLGLRQQDRMWAAKRPRPGDTFTFRRYEPTYNCVLTVRVEVKEKESIDLGGTRRSLLRVEMTPDRLEAPGIRITPPRATCWLDDTWTPVRRRTEIDGLGTLVLTRTTKDKLQVPAGAATLDVGARSLVPLDRGMPRPYDSRKATYRLTVQGAVHPAELVIQDDHQRVSQEKDDSFVLTVEPVRPARLAGSTAKPGEEYLASSHFIDCDDEGVVGLTRRATAGERDPWKKALRIERWVKGAMRNDNAAGLAPASQTARTLRGDCRHHAFLTAAMCRAAGLPSRTAIGLLYVYRGGPRMGFHTWTEVFIDGRWVGIDSTLGRGGVSAAHLKVTQHSWHRTESLTPLLPVNRVLGKLRVEILRAE